jgi:hypothetical protein
MVGGWKKVLEVLKRFVSSKSKIKSSLIFQKLLLLSLTQMEKLVNSKKKKKKKNKNIIENFIKNVSKLLNKGKKLNKFYLIR